ncbi:MAG TPA: HD domain-containing protein [Candidatus Aminicenantes bacterium]|nr:HD domain-containing protein [Candidatus Aminicenantes bacterium]
MNNHSQNYQNNFKIIIIDSDKKFSRRLAELFQPLKVEAAVLEKLPDVARLNQIKNGVLLFSFSERSIERLQSLQEIKKSLPRLSTIILTGATAGNKLLPYLQQGIIDFICPRHNFMAIYSAIKSAISLNQLKQENEYYLKNLAKLKMERSQHIRKMLELEEIYDTTVENLMTALDLRDVETFGHSQTVSKYSQVLAEILGIKNQVILDNIRKGALLHDIGKIAIPDSILKKPGQLTAEEWEKIKLHPTLGYGLVKEMKLLREVGNIILYHHEKYDGSGYPKGLKKEEIPMEARIFALADALDAITSHRPYRPEKDFSAAREEIIQHASSQFDPVVVEAFCSVDIDQWERIRFETTKLLPSFEDYQKLIKSKNSANHLKNILK